MNYTKQQMNIIFNKYIKFVDDLPLEYEDNIKNLLYIIVPAFVLKYGINNEKVILNTFKDVIVLIKNDKNIHVQAYYQNIPKFNNNNIDQHKFIVLQNYNEKDLVRLMDNLVHEYNHAINSYNKSLKEVNNEIYLRTGISYFTYDKKTLRFKRKANNYVLEEILNTKETEDVINIIHTFKNYEFDNKKINTILYLLDTHTKDKFSSDAYKLEMIITKDLIENKTFYSTFSKLRLSGDIEEIDYFFNSITGANDSYNKLMTILYNISNIKNENYKWKFQHKKRNEKIRKLYLEAKEIIDLFNNNCNFK